MSKPFVPPKVRQHIWATYVEDRSPQFKVHSSEGLANSAVGYHYPGTTVVKYKLQDGEWQVYETYETPKTCAWCEQPFVKVMWSRLHFRPREAKGPEYRKPVICADCHKKDYEAWLEKTKVQSELYELQRLKSLYEG
jgi:hypothetical protein